VLLSWRNLSCWLRNSIELSWLTNVGKRAKLYRENRNEKFQEMIDRRGTLSSCSNVAVARTSPRSRIPNLPIREYRLLIALCTQNTTNRLQTANTDTIITNKQTIFINKILSCMDSTSEVRHMINKIVWSKNFYRKATWFMGHNTSWTASNPEFTIHIE